MKIDSILNVTCSKAANKEAAPVDCNLLDELQNSAYLTRQNKLRAETDPDKQDLLKQAFPVLLPSCKCKGSKSKTGIVKHSGFICIDIDEKDNLNVANFADLKTEFAKLLHVAYCGLSLRGKGYFLLIKIAHPDRHQLHFKFVEQFFKAKGITIDPSGINVNRLRFYSYDSKAYYNHAAATLQSYFVPPVVEVKQSYQKGIDAGNSPVWDLYNTSTEFIEVLQKHGWNIESQSGAKTFFTRPGKAAGVSAEFDSSKNIFFVFTSNAEPFESLKGYNPFQVFTLLEHGNDFTQAAKALIYAGKIAQAKNDFQ